MDELFYELSRFVIRKLFGGMFHRKGRDRNEGPADLALTGEAAAADGVDRTSGAVRRVLNRKSEFQGDWKARKSAAFNSEETDLLVILPGHVIRRADVDIVFLKRDIQLALNGHGL